MHAGRSYKLSEFLFWTRRSIYWLTVLSIAATVLYELAGFRWLAVPFTIIGLLGTATAFIITFRNQETYNRTWEAREIWGATMSACRSWAMMCRDFLHDADKSKELICRQLAWLTALRYQLRKNKYWENQKKAYNEEFRQYYRVPEHETPLEKELEKYIPQAEISIIATASNKATQLLGLQSATLKRFRDEDSLEEFRFLELQNSLKDFSGHHGKS
jgi:putative membrane protein